VGLSSRGFHDLDPARPAKEVGASEGKKADMTVENGALVVKVAKPKKRRRYMLEQLLNGITEENRHAAIEWGPPVGNEAW
jgi:antitoxin MazE